MEIFEKLSEIYKNLIAFFSLFVDNKVFTATQKGGSCNEKELNELGYDFWAEVSNKRDILKLNVETKNLPSLIIPQIKFFENSPIDEFTKNNVTQYNGTILNIEIVNTIFDKKYAITNVAVSIFSLLDKNATNYIYSAIEEKNFRFANQMIKLFLNSKYTYSEYLPCKLLNFSLSERAPLNRTSPFTEFHSYLIGHIISLQAIVNL